MDLGRIAHGDQDTGEVRGSYESETDWQLILFRTKLRYQIAKPPSEKDEPGYMYVHEIARKDRTGGIKTCKTSVFRSLWLAC